MLKYIFNFQTADCRLCTSYSGYNNCRLSTMWTQAHREPKCPDNFGELFDIVTLPQKFLCYMELITWQKFGLYYLCQAQTDRQQHFIGKVVTSLFRGFGMGREEGRTTRFFRGPSSAVLLLLICGCQSHWGFWILAM